jgi:hypothetical protein
VCRASSKERSKWIARDILANKMERMILRFVRLRYFFIFIFLEWGIILGGEPRFYINKINKS